MQGAIQVLWFVFSYLLMCVEDFTPIRGKITTETNKTTAERVIPPYNGFGSDEDSLSNCLSLLPRPPKRDFSRFMELDKAGYEGHVLRFLARLQQTRPDPTGLNEHRKFIICYFLADGTVSVYEQSSRTGMYAICMLLLLSLRLWV